MGDVRRLTTLLASNQARHRWGLSWAACAGRGLRHSKWHKEARLAPLLIAVTSTARIARVPRTVFDNPAPGYSQ